MKKVTILGSTGSIGTQALDVIQRNPDRFRVTALTCGKNVSRLREQILTFQPQTVCCESKDHAEMLRTEFPVLRVLHGPEGLNQIAEEDCDILLNALMGMRGLEPTYRAIQAGHDIAFANKETLVAGGHVIMDAVHRKGVRMLPVDSEHSAIFQCLEGNRGKEIRRILLTASGGPFRGWTYDRLKTVTPEMALRHPNWTMGAKITIDSATMMNKGLEIIEAKWLFDVDIDRICPVVHPQSVIHSAVEFTDSSVLAQLGIPDMRIPIGVALAYPDRLSFPDLALDLFQMENGLTFDQPDMEVFRCMKLAIQASREGGSYPVVMNAANEILVQAFLDKRIGFTEIPERIEEQLEHHTSVPEPDLPEILRIDRETRERTESSIS